MFNKKIAILTAVLSTLYLYFNSIPVKDGFDQPFNYRLTLTTLTLFSKLGNLFKRLNIAPDYKVVREIVDLVAFDGLDKNDKSVRVEFKNLNGVDVRIFTPNVKTEKPFPVLIYFHGGGFVFRNIVAYDPMHFLIAEESNIVVISVDYRLAPEHPFPVPTTDCWNVVDYVIKNPIKFNVNVNKLILGGDSAGGNVALILNKRLAKETSVRPKLQILLYPWVQFPFVNLPSSINNKGGILTVLDLTKMKLWYTGIRDVTDEMKAAIDSNNITLLLTQEERVKLASYVNIDLIPQKYKTNKAYYEMYKKIPLINSGTLEPDNILVRDKEFAKKVKLFFSKELSPLLSDSDELNLMPKTYQITCEWDSLKDQGLILAERLKQVGVEVEVAFYENCFHGMVSLLDKNLGFKHSYDILNDLTNYIKKNV